MITKKEGEREICSSRDDSCGLGKEKEGDEDEELLTGCG